MSAIHEQDDSVPSSWRAIITYIVLVAVLSAPWCLLLIRTGSLDIGRGFPTHTLMWSPGLAAILTCLLFRRPLKSLGFAWPAGRYMALGYLLPLFYSCVTYAILWITQLAPLQWSVFAAASAKSLHLSFGAGALNAALILTFGVVQSAASATGEEIGWRGFLVPALSRHMRFGAMALVSGLIWALWHFPLIIWSDYTGAAPVGFSLACFTVMIVATGSLAAWLRLRSGSVWPAALLHAAHNAIIQWLLDPMTAQTGKASWFVGEFGVCLALVSLVISLLWVARAKR